MTDTSLIAGEERVVPSHVDDDYTRAFIDGWNARLEYSDFDMALHFWMLSHTRPMAPTTETPND